MSDENGSSAQYPFTALQALELAKVYLENACSTTDTDIALALCQDVETSLLKSEHDAKPSQDHLVLKAIGTEYARLANLLRGLGRQDEAQASQRKAEELGVHTREQDSVGSSPESPVDKSPITWRNLAKDPLVLQRLADRVRHEPSFKQELLDYIERSKEDKQWRVAAANAITILVLAGVQFNHADLRGIRIPNADLTYGVFESAQLQGADLRNVSLCGTWLRNANMSQARMMGVQFGERPSLSDSGYICVPSPDDTTLSIVAEEAIIHVYSTSTWERIWTLEGHTLDINVIVYSPNGNQLASGANDNTVRLWDIKSGSCSYVLRCHDARGSRRRRVHSVAYSPGGDQVATAGTNLVIQLWDTSSGECLYFLIGHPSTIKCVIYSQTGNSIVSSAANGTIRQWNLNTSKHPRFIRGHLDGVEMLLLSPQGNRLVSSSYDRSVRVWNMSTGKCLLTFAGMNHASAIRYSPRDEQVAIAGEDDTIYLWDTLSGAQLALEGHSGCIFDIAYSPKGDLLASCSHDGTVRLWDTVSGICRQTITGEPDTFQFICFSLKGDFIITGDEKTAIRLFDVASTRSRRILDCHHDQATKVVYSPNGNQVATCGADKTIKLWDSDSGECLYTLHGHTSRMITVVYSPAGNRLASSSLDGTVRLWNTETGSWVNTIANHSHGNRVMSFSPQGHQLATYCNDHSVCVWSVESEQGLHTLVGHTAFVCTIAYSPDGSRMATCSNDGTIRLWDPASGVCFRTIHCDKGCLTSLLYLSNGDHVAVSSCDGISLWDTTTGDHLLDLPEESGSHRCIASTPNIDGGSNIIATLGDKKYSIRLWDSQSGQCRHVLLGHTSIILNAAFSTSGTMIASSSRDQTVRLWNVASGECLAVLEGFPSQVWEVAWGHCPTGDKLVASCRDGSLVHWNIVLTDEGECQVQLGWRVTRGLFSMEGANIQDVQGLSPLNRKLLEQRGAIGKPVDL